MKPVVLLGLASALALAACSSGNDADQTAADTATPAIAPSPTEVANAMPDTSTPQGFVDAAVASDMYELQAAKLAQQMGKGEAVKSFATMMVKDHATSSQKLKDAVAKAGGDLNVPTALPARQQQMLDQLKNAGENFDQTYGMQQAAAHREALALLEGQAERGTEEPLKAFAKETIPAVQHHLEEAEKLS